MQRIVTSLDSRHPERGFGSGEILQSIRKQLHSRTEHLLLILDEVDHLLRADKGDLLYQLLRIDEGRESRGTISLIIISQEQVLDQLEGAVLSRFGKSNHIRLEPYKAPALAAIAQQRAQLSCVDETVSEAVLRTVGERASETGDARVAIELLDNAIKQAEPGDIILIAGKGHETEQVIGAEKTVCNDAQTVQLHLSLKREVV